MGCIPDPAVIEYDINDLSEVIKLLLSSEPCRLIILKPICDDMLIFVLTENQ